MTRDADARNRSVGNAIAVLDRLPEHQPALRRVEPLSRANVSTQYLAALAFASALARPVLWPAELAAFDLDRAFGIVSDVAARMGPAP